MEIRAVCVGIDLYQFQIKQSSISSWKTVYSGNFPIRAKRKDIEKVKLAIMKGIYIRLE